MPNSGNQNYSFYTSKNAKKWVKPGYSLKTLPCKINVYLTRIKISIQVENNFDDCKDNRNWSVVEGSQKRKKQKRSIKKNKKLDYKSNSVNNEFEVKFRKILLIYLSKCFCESKVIFVNRTYLAEHICCCFQLPIWTTHSLHSLLPRHDIVNFAKFDAQTSHAF